MTMDVANIHIPKEMKAIRYNKIKDFALVTLPVPQPRAHEVLVKGAQLTCPTTRD